MDKMSIEQLRQLRQVDPQDVGRENLVELKDIRIDKSLPIPERVADFIEKIHNPYCFKVDGVVVKLKFTEGGGSCQNAFYSMADAMR